MAEAAGSAGCARLPMAPVSAVCRLAAVAAGVAPMVNWFAPGGEAVVACNVIVWLEPSGRVKLNAIDSPGFGLVAPSATEIEGGEPDGPVAVAPVRFELTPASWKPNGEPSALSVTFEPVPPTVRRPSPLVPRSACWRCAITWGRAARAPLPL